MKKITLINVYLLVILSSARYVSSTQKPLHKNDATDCSKSKHFHAARAEKDALSDTSQKRRAKITRHRSLCRRNYENRGTKRGSVNLAPSALWELRRKLSEARTMAGDKDVVEHIPKIPTFGEYASVRTKPLVIRTYHEGQDFRKATVSTDDNAEKFVFHLENEPHASPDDNLLDKNDDMPYLMQHANTHSKYVVNIDDDEKAAKLLERRKSTKDPEDNTVKAKFAEAGDDIREDKETDVFKHSEKEKEREKERDEEEYSDKKKDRHKNKNRENNISAKAKKLLLEEPKLSGVPDEVYTGFKPSLRKPFSDRAEESSDKQEKPRRKVSENVKYPSPRFAWQKETVATQDDTEFANAQGDDDIKETTQVQSTDNNKNVSYTPSVIQEKATNYSNESINGELKREQDVNYGNMNNSDNANKPSPGGRAESDVKAGNANEPLYQPAAGTKNAAPVNEKNKSGKNANQYQTNNEEENIKISEQMDKLLKKEKAEDKKKQHRAEAFAQGKGKFRGKVLQSELMEYKKLVNSSDTGSYIKSEKDPITPVGAAESSPMATDSYMSDEGTSKSEGTKFAEVVTNGNMSEDGKHVNYNDDDMSVYGNTIAEMKPNGDTGKSVALIETKLEAGEEIGNKPTTDSNLDTGLKSVQSIEDGRDREDYGNVDSSLGNGNADSSLGSKLHTNQRTNSHEGANTDNKRLRKPMIASEKIDAIRHTPTESSIISQKLREIDSRAKSEHALSHLNSEAKPEKQKDDEYYLQPSTNTTLSNGQYPKEELSADDLGEKTTQYIGKQTPERVSQSLQQSIPAKQTVPTSNIHRITNYKDANAKPQNKEALDSAYVSGDDKNFRQKMAAYDSFLNHVGSNVVDTSACLRSDDPLKCENKAILKSSSVINQLDKELSKISSSAINELNQELSRTPPPDAVTSKLERTSPSKESNDEVEGKDLNKEFSKASSLDETNKEGIKSSPPDEFSKDELVKPSTPDEFSNEIESFVEPTKEELEKDISLASPSNNLNKVPDIPSAQQDKELYTSISDESKKPPSPVSPFLPFSSAASRGSSPAADKFNEDVIKPSLSDHLPRHAQSSMKQFGNLTENNLTAYGTRKYGDMLADKFDGNKAALTTTMFKHGSGKALAPALPVYMLGKATSLRTKYAREQAARFVLAQRHRYAMEMKRRRLLAEQARALACQRSEVPELRKRGSIPQKRSLCNRNYNQVKQAESLRHNANILSNSGNQIMPGDVYNNGFKAALNRTLPDYNYNDMSGTSSVIAEQNMHNRLHFRDKYAKFHERPSHAAISSEPDDNKYGTLLHKLYNLKESFAPNALQQDGSANFNTKLLMRHNPESLNEFGAPSRNNYNSFADFSSNKLEPYKPPHPKGPSIVFDQFTSVGVHHALMFPGKQHGPEETVVTRTHISNTTRKTKRHHKHSRHATSNKHVAKIGYTRDHDPPPKSGPNYGYGSGNGHGYGTNSWGWGGGGGWAGTPPPGGIPSPGDYSPPASAAPAQAPPAASAAATQQPATPSAQASAAAPPPQAQPAASPAAQAPPPAPQASYQANKTSATNKTAPATHVKLTPVKVKHIDFAKDKHQTETNSTTGEKINLKLKKSKSLVKTKEEIYTSKESRKHDSISTKDLGTSKRKTRKNVSTAKTVKRRH